MKSQDSEETIKLFASTAHNSVVDGTAPPEETIG